MPNNQNSYIANEKRIPRLRLDRKSNDIVSKWRKKDKATILALIKIIMSSRSIHEQRTKAVECLKSDPDALRSLIKMSIENTCHHDKKSVSPSLETTQVSNETINQVDANVPDQLQNHDSERVINDRNKVTPFSKSTHLTSNSTDVISDTNRTDAITNSEEFKVDFVHHRRKAIPHTYPAPRNQRYKERITPHGKNDFKDIKPNDDKFENLFIVRTLLDMLVHANCKYTQDMVLSVLRSNEQIRKLFINEKEKLGKQMIPIFKEQDNQLFTDNSRHYGNTLERQPEFEISVSNPTLQQRNGFVHMLTSPLESTYSIPILQSKEISRYGNYVEYKDNENIVSEHTNTNAFQHYILEKSEAPIQQSEDLKGNSTPVCYPAPFSPTPNISNEFPSKFDFPEYDQCEEIYNIFPSMS